MILKLQRSDLNRPKKWDPTCNISFRHFNERAQQCILIAGRATFTSESPDKEILPPTDETFHLESAAVSSRDGRKTIVIWKKGVQLVQVSVRSSKEISRFLKMLRESPYSFDRIALAQAYDYPASMAAGKPVLHSGPLDLVGIFVPYADFVKLAARHVEMLMKL